MSQFKDRLYEQYVSTHFGRLHKPSLEMFESYARFYQATLLPFLPKDKNAPILEVGCGLGQFLYFLKKQGYVNHLGIDIGKEQLASCSDNVTPQVQWVPDTNQYLKEKRGAYSAIVLIDVLEHFDDGDLFPILDVILQALAPGGKIIVAVPNASCIPSLMTRYGDLTHHRLFTESSLSQLLLTAGFTNVNILPHEKKVIRSFRSRRERWIWSLRDKFVRWLMSEFYLHLMEGAYPNIQTINLLGIAEAPDRTTSSL
jgi:2-polyprenyl-3-methyl-5-hydroxy-6-metoxy-1,4-benzoquinol methylase